MNMNGTVGRPKLAMALVRFLMSLAVGLALTASAAAQTTNTDWNSFLAGSGLVYRAVAPGVGYASMTYPGKPHPVIYHVVKADLNDTSIRLGAIRSQMADNGDMIADTLTNMTALALNQRPGCRLVAAINADYFGRRVHGGHIQDGDPIAFPNARSAFIIDEDGRPSIAKLKMAIELRFGETGAWHAVKSLNNCRPARNAPDTINLPSAWQQFTLTDGLAAVARVTSRLPEKIDARIVGIPAQGSCVTNPGNCLLVWSARPEWIACMQTGTVVTVRTGITPTAEDAVTGGPRIVRGGRVSLEFDLEGWRPVDAARLKAANPRSAAGISHDGTTVWLMMVEGRRSTSRGLDAAELATLMINLGCWDALNLDGGGSAALYTPMISVVTQNPPRPIKNALAVFRQE